MLDDDNTRIFHVFEMQIGMNEFDYGTLVLLKQQRERPENSGLSGDLNPDLCSAGAVLNQSNYQANWELVIMWVNCKPVDEQMMISFSCI